MAQEFPEMPNVSKIERHLCFRDWEDNAQIEMVLKNGSLPFVLSKAPVGPNKGQYFVSILKPDQRIEQHAFIPTANGFKDPKTNKEHISLGSLINEVYPEKNRRLKEKRDALALQQKEYEQRQEDEKEAASKQVLLGATSDDLPPQLLLRRTESTLPPLPDSAERKFSADKPVLLLSKALVRKSSAHETTQPFNKIQLENAQEYLQKIDPASPEIEGLYNQITDCRISTDEMEDPVILKTDGVSYDRKNISMWLEKESTSPANRAPSSQDDVISNYGVKMHLVKEAEVNPTLKYRTIIDSLLCPISNEIMEDPVFLVQDGITYDRESLKNARGKSPLTGQPFTEEDIIPNRAVRDAIDNISQPKKQLSP